MAFCQNCGTQLNEGSKFCPNCGTPMQMESGAASALQEGNPVAVEAAATEPMQAAASSVAVLEKDVAPAAPAQEQPAPQPGVYQQSAPQPDVYQQPAPQPDVYQQPAPQPGVYQQPAPQQGAYQQPAPQPGVYQQPAPQQGVYQQPVQGYVPSEAQMKKGMAILAYFGILFLIPLFAAKNDPFARYHTNQGLVLFIFMVIFNILSNVLTNILIEISPMLTLIVSGVFGILTLLLCIFALIGIIRAAKGQMKPLPIIGGIRILK